MHKKVSVVIPTYNQKKDLIDAIDSLLQQEYPVFEIIVVDNASTDGTSMAIKTLLKKSVYKKVVLIQNKKNLGVTGGRNSGLHATRGDYILFFDHDMVAEPEMVWELVKTLESKKNIGVVTPKIYFWDRKNIIWAAGTDINLTTGQVIFHGGEDKGQYNIVKEVAIAPAVLLVKKDVTKKIGGFDDTYFAVYEDTDFCFRAKKAGFTTYYTPYAIAYHKIPYDNDLASRRLLGRAYWVARNRIIFMKRFAENFPVFILFSPVYLLYYVQLAVRYKNFRAIFAYLKGFFAGFSVGFPKKPPSKFTYPWIIRRLFGNKKSILDVGCGDGELMAIINSDGRYIVTGVDLYKPYLQQVKQRGVYSKALYGDVRKLRFKQASFDIVFSSQVIEHLEKSDALKVLRTMEQLASKKIIVATTNGFFPFEPLGGKDKNPLQVHKSGWEIGEMKKLGYTVYGQGLGIVYKPGGLAHRIPYLNYLWFGLSYLFSPITYKFPQLAAYLIASKEK